MKATVMPDRCTESQENYLEAILVCADEDGRARVTDIADRLDVRMASVTEALRNLAERGLVEYRPYARPRLTEEGRGVARGVWKHHGLLKRFLTTVLGLEPDEAEENACRMEHTMDEKALERMAAYMEFIEKCPGDGCTWQEERGGFCRKHGTGGCR